MTFGGTSGDNTSLSSIGQSSPLIRVRFGVQVTEGGPITNLPASAGFFDYMEVFYEII